MTANVKIKMTKAVERAVEKAIPKTLNEAGKYVWRIARASIKQRKNPNKSSAPGTAPHGHKSSMNAGFKKTIVYAPTSDKKAVLVGPQLVKGGLNNVARTHEFGGSRRLKEYSPDLRDGVNIGDVAPVTVVHLTRKDSVIKKDGHADPRTGRKVVWIKIRTKTQQKHSQRLYSRLNRKYGKTVSANYPARPYMAPALELSKPKLSRFWRGSVKQ